MSTRDRLSWAKIGIELAMNDGLAALGSDQANQLMMVEVICTKVDVTLKKGHRLFS